jgi:hypothetical protein
MILKKREAFFNQNPVIDLTLAEKNRIFIVFARHSYIILALQFNL